MMMVTHKYRLTQKDAKSARSRYKYYKAAKCCFDSHARARLVIPIGLNVTKNLSVVILKVESDTTFYFTGLMKTTSSIPALKRTIALRQLYSAESTRSALSLSTWS